MLNKKYKEKKYLEVSSKIMAGGNKVSGDVITNRKMGKLTDEKGVEKGTKTNQSFTVFQITVLAV